MTKDRQECSGAPGGDSPVPDSRSFLGRAAAFLIAEAGLSQFLALGTGTGPEGGSRDVAREMRPGIRIVYADRDPAALSQARSLLAGRAPGTTDFFQADPRDPGSVLGRAADTLDFGRPVGVLLHVAGEAGDPHRIVTVLMNVLPGGSYLAVTGGDEAETARFLDGLSLVEPGPARVSATLWGGMARKA